MFIIGYQSRNRLYTSCSRVAKFQMGNRLLFCSGVDVELGINEGNTDKIASKKKRVLSGVQPTGTLHIGNYLGAIRQWVQNQELYENYFCVVDLHAITVPHDPKKLRKETLQAAAMYIAAGNDMPCFTSIE